MQLTGFAPTLVLGEDVAVPVGSVSLAGVAPRLNISITPNAGSLVVTGPAPRLDSHVTPGAGALTLTGAASTLGHVVFPTLATLTLTGSTPTVSVTGDATRTPSAATLMLTGYAPTITATTTTTKRTTKGGAGYPVTWIVYERKRQRRRTQQDLFDDIERTLREELFGRAPGVKPTPRPPQIPPTPEPFHDIRRLEKIAKTHRDLRTRLDWLKQDIVNLQQERVRRARLIEEDDQEILLLI